MREILFKGFSPNEHGIKTITVNGEKVRGNWVEGQVCTAVEQSWIVYDKDFYTQTAYASVGLKADRFCEIIPETVCQCTGLTDRNGVRIFEGDVIKYKCGDIAEVIFTNYGAFVGLTETLSHEGLSGEVLVEVVGNIYDNKELLEEV